MERVLKSSYHRDTSYSVQSGQVFCWVGGLHCKLVTKLIKVCGRALRLLNGSHPCGNIRPTQLSFVAYIYVFVNSLKVGKGRCVKTSRPFSKGDFSIGGTFTGNYGKQILGI